MSATVTKDGLAGQVEEAPVSGDIGGTAMDVDIDVEQLPQALRELVTQLRAVPATIKEVDLAGPDQGGDYFRMDPSADVEDDAGAGAGALWYRKVRLWVLGLIGTCPSLRVVKLGDWASAVNCGISSESEVERLCEGLKSNQVLRWLSLDGNIGFGSEFGCRQVSQILASRSSSLVTLGMFGVRLKAAGLSQLMSTLLANKAGSRLQVLNVESNPECLADERAARLLGQLVSRKCLRKLGIQRTGLTVAGAALISAALGATALQTLQVGGGPEPILNVIVSSLSRCRRLSLLFTKEDLEEEASQIAEPLAQMLRTNTSLRKLTLHMKSVGLKAAGLSQLLSTLLASKAGSRLQILDVEHNPECLADERAARLLGQLVSSKGLRELRIRETGLTVAGAALISAALKGATALQRLQVGGGPEPILNVIVSSHSRCSELHLLFCKEDLEEEASQLAEPLAQMLRTNTSLRKLWLENADFSTKAWRCIFQALGAANSTLSFLSLGGSTTLDHGLIDDLYQLLASNPRLALAEIRNAPLKGPSTRTLKSGGFFYCTCSSCRQLHLGEGPGSGGEILNVEHLPKELRPLIAALTAVPSLSPGLFQASLHFLLENWCTLTNDGTVNVELEVDGPEVKVFLDEVCQSFAAELVTLLGSSLGGGAVQEEGGSDYILQQLSLCLLLALAPSIPNACEIKTSETWIAYKPRYGGEQAVDVQVLYSALLSQHWSNGVRRLKIGGSGAFGSDRGCKHLAYLLKSGHCKLQELQIFSTSTGTGGMRHISRALETNCSLRVLDIGGCKVGDGGVEQLAAALRTNSTLQDLTLIEIGMSAHGLRHLCDALQSTQPWRLRATSSSPGGTRHNMGGVKKLKISHNALENGGVALLGAMLANNSCLESLEASHCNLVEEDGEGHLGKGLQENSTLQELDISVNPMLGKVALGVLVRSLATNSSTALKTLLMNEVKKMPAAEELAHMIISNRSLENLGMGGAEYEHGEWATVILPALGRNRTLLFIDLSCCQGVKGEVRAALFHLLRINTTIQQIELLGTPLYHSGQAEGVQVELRRNGEFRHALSALPQVKPKSCRIVLCGNAYAGKSKLFETMKLLALQEDPQAMTSSSKDWMERLLLDRSFHNYDNLKDKELSKRTRGIEIHLLKDELDCRISVWDLAGQREFHAMHDIMFPSGNNAATVFVLTFSPIVSPVDELRAGELKKSLELEEELQYWLRYIASNCKPCVAAPTVVVVITHKDTLVKLGINVESWLRGAKDLIAGLAAKFSGRVKVQPQPFMVNALASQDVELKRWVKEVEKLLRRTLDGLPEEPALCTQVLKAVHELSQTNSNSPVISRVEFENICVSLAPNMEVEMAKVKTKKQKVTRGPEFLTGVGVRIGTTMGAYLHDAEQVQVLHPEGQDDAKEVKHHEGQYMETHSVNHVKRGGGAAKKRKLREGQVDNEPKFLATVGGKIGTIVGAYLHDAGEVIHHAMLNLIVTNPKWFCHGVLGQLIDLFPSSQRPLRPKNGFVTRVYLSSLLQEAMESVQGFDPTIVTPDQLIQIMLLLDLCYEQTPGDPNTDYFLPAIFEDGGNKAADGKRPVTWRKLKSKASTFVGRRLQCSDLQRTFLTDGFFPRLQVVLHNYVFKKKWVANKHSNTYMLEKNLFSIWVNSMEILIEFSGSSGDFVDILVKSSKSRQQVMEFLGPNIIGTIRTFCASQEGCQGVTLAEAIIRPDCLYGAEGGNPILCTYRRDQSILVVELTEKMKLMPDYDHCWDKVEDNVGGLVLPDGQDSGTWLLEGTQDVAPGPEPSNKWPGVEDSCYPNNNRKQGRKRGLALIVSMEKERPGGAADRGTLRTLAVACGFDEIVLVDRKASELSSIINSVVEDVLEEDECFVCFINGHGGTENGKPFILDEEKLRIMVNPVIVDPFRRSKHLQGKPKVFVINGCRGSTQYVHFDSVGADTDIQQMTGSLLPHVTELSDCLLVFSTSEGFPSCRDPLAGTVFVNQFMQTVLGKKETTDVLSMMTMVNERVNEVLSTREDPLTETKVIVGQCCEVKSTLRKKLYWSEA